MIAKRLRRTKLLITSNILWILAGIVLAVGIVLGWSQYVQNKAIDKKVSLTIQSANEGRSTVVPSTKKATVDEFSQYQVAADMPRYLFIPDISVRAMIKPEGLTKDNQIDVPRNAFDVGWYNGSAKPGQAGAMLVDGHVSGGNIPGIFYNLKDLTPGMTLKVERGDGEMLTYRVVKSESYDYKNVDMQAALSPVNSNARGLNLITCDGQVIKGSNNFDKRLVIFTEEI
jgi:sortase (surface protein transpeptidase)